MDWFFRLWFAFIALMMITMLVLGATFAYRAIKLAEHTNISVTTEVKTK